MFKKLSPQRVQHDDGFIVQVASRTVVEYIESLRKASVEVDFAKTVGVYAHTLKNWQSDAMFSPMTDSEQHEVLSRIVAGLQAMGCDVEVC